MRYCIKRECWNKKTYNGYEDAPYWLIQFGIYKIGLLDNGEYWSVINGMELDENVQDELKTIIKECKLNIKLKAA